MTTLTPGHRYALANFEDTESFQYLQFIEKVPTNFPNPNNTLITVFDGTTNEEVLAVLIDRMEYLQNKFPCQENIKVISNLKIALMTLNERTANRKARGVEGRQLK